MPKPKKRSGHRPKKKKGSGAAREDSRVLSPETIANLERIAAEAKKG